MREREEEEYYKARNGKYGGDYWNSDKPSKDSTSPNHLSPRTPEYHSNAAAGNSIYTTATAVPSTTNPYNAWNNSYDDYNHYHRQHNKAGPVPKWGFKDTDLKRQRRVVRYKAYAVEGKMKASVRSGFCWIKNKYRELFYGYY